MKYKNGRDVLPPDLLTEVQKYLCGEILYIPKKDDVKASWGQLSGLRQEVRARNIDIVNSYRNGASINDLTEDFCLSEASIRKIIYSNKALLQA